MAGTRVSSDSPKRLRLRASTVEPGPICAQGDKRSQFATWRTGIQTKPQLETPGLGRFALLAMTRARRRELFRGGATRSRKKLRGARGSERQRSRLNSLRAEQQGSNSRRQGINS